ncbi:hypothetical protein LguiB_027346 [Lonicera macranthoides]
MLFENLPLFEAFTCLLFSLGGAGDNTAVKLIRCKDKERQALLDLKKEFMDNGGFHLSSLGSQEEDRCKWRGIHCNNSTGHVILLDLRGWYDYGTDNLVCLSGKLGNLPNLRSLHLGVNYNLTIENLEWLSDLHLLRHLDLRCSIPDVFGNMMSLESLSLSNCAFESEIPKSFKNLSPSNKSLDILDLSENKFSGSLSDFTSFSSLRQLLVSSNKLNGSFPKHFGQSSPLEYLDLSKNEFNGSLHDLTSFPLLRDLYLTNNKIQGRLPESIGELSKLKELCLSFNLLTLEFSSDWTPRFQLDFIAISIFKLHVGTSFPIIASISK